MLYLQASGRQLAAFTAQRGRRTEMERMRLPQLFSLGVAHHKYTLRSAEHRGAWLSHQREFEAM